MFDDSIKFKYNWRNYQERILNEVKKYINDKKINIVAAPGSGKTIIGLELTRIINNPVIILAPTIVIRDQWVERFINNFTNFKNIPDWISTDIYNLKFFNVVTYQSLHYAYKKQVNKADTDNDTDDITEDEDNKVIDKDIIKTYDLINQINEKNITTIVLDEAHHLKSEWWKSLISVVKNIKDHTIISLTATPPYDVEYSMWKKYEELCGEVDAEISIPELVADNNLCPHQDYIYFSYPTKEEKESISKYNVKLYDLINNIKKDTNLINAVANHKYIKSPKSYEEEILSNVSYYSSMLIFLNSANVRIPRDNVAILGHNKTIPRLTVEWLEILLKNIIFDDTKNYKNYEDTIKNIKSMLNSLGIIEKRDIIIRENNYLKKIFLNSSAKLESINKIVDIEYSNLKDSLRMVILTDYIRKEYLEDTNISVNKIGVLPIFINLLNSNVSYKLAILTGSFFIIPKLLKQKLIDLCIEEKINLDRINFQKLNISNDYILLNINGNEKNKVMGLIQSLFSNGQINIIIGTKSLLGEGWDEPSINSLILASFVGSYMLSNQMRGRAIRVNKDPNKTANIWHLVCVNDKTIYDSSEEIENVNYNLDFEMLKRRFNGIIGIDYDYDIIQNGIERLNGVYPPFNKDKVIQINKKMEDLSINRSLMYKRWKDITNKLNDCNYKICDKLDIPKSEYFNKMWSIDYKFLITLILEIIFLVIVVMTGSVYSTIILLINTIFTLIAIFKEIKIFTPRKIIEQVGYTILQCLCEFKFIKTNFHNMKVIAKQNNSNNLVETYIIGGTSYENNLFIQALRELFDKSTVQRYFIAKLDLTKNKIKDYYNVPKILSQNKEISSRFHKIWCKRISNCSLIYSNNKVGRALLIKARMKNINFVSKVAMGKKAIFWK